MFQGQAQVNAYIDLYKLSWGACAVIWTAWQRFSPLGQSPVRSGCRSSWPVIALDVGGTPKAGVDGRLKVTVWTVIAAMFMAYHLHGGQGDHGLAPDHALEFTDSTPCDWVPGVVSILEGHHPVNYVWMEVKDWRWDVRRCINTYT